MLWTWKATNSRDISGILISVCFQRREIATEEKGIESCLVENKECIQIVETCKIIFNCSRISIVLGLVSILRFSFPNAEAMSSTFLKCE